MSSGQYGMSTHVMTNLPLWDKLRCCYQLTLCGIKSTVVASFPLLLPVDFVWDKVHCCCQLTLCGIQSTVVTSWLCVGYSPLLLPVDFVWDKVHCCYQLTLCGIQSIFVTRITIRCWFQFALCGRKDSPLWPVHRVWGKTRCCHQGKIHCCHQFTECELFKSRITSAVVTRTKSIAVTSLPSVSYLSPG